MTPPESRSATRKEESDSDMDEVNMADEMSSTSSEAAFSFVRLLSIYFLFLRVLFQFL